MRDASRWVFLILLSSLVAASAWSCGSDTDAPSSAADASSVSGGDGGEAGATGPKTVCAPACAVDEVCAEPGACPFDAKCIKRADVSCPDGGYVCNSPACAGEWTNDGGTFHCICR